MGMHAGMESEPDRQQRTTEQPVGFHALPDEVVLKIFQHCAHKLLASMRQVNRQFNRVASDPVLWKNVDLPNIMEDQLKKFARGFAKKVDIESLAIGSRYIPPVAVSSQNPPNRNDPSNFGGFSRATLLDVQEACPNLKFLLFRCCAVRVEELPFHRFSSELVRLEFVMCCIHASSHNGGFECFRMLQNLVALRFRACRGLNSRVFEEFVEMKELRELSLRYCPIDLHGSHQPTIARSKSHLVSFDFSGCVGNGIAASVIEPLLVGATSTLENLYLEACNSVDVLRMCVGLNYDRLREVSVGRCDPVDELMIRSFAQKGIREMNASACFLTCYQRARLYRAFRSIRFNLQAIYRPSKVARVSKVGSKLLEKVLSDFVCDHSLPCICR